jgi:hypothetical protein
MPFKTSRRYGRVKVANSYLGDSVVATACSDLTTLAQTTVAAMTEYQHSRETTLPMLFADDTLAKLKQVRGMVKARDRIKFYPMLLNTRLAIDYEGALVPAIERDCFVVNPDRSGPLLHYIKAVEAIHRQFEEVKAVLRWLNENATPGAIRYYFPAAMTLCPQALSADVPSRHKTPEGISNWIQPIRDAAATVVSSLLLPSTAVPKARGNMWLTFDPWTVQVAGGASYATDPVTYNI